MDCTWRTEGRDAKSKIRMSGEEVATASLGKDGSNAREVIGWGERTEDCQRRVP